MRIFVLIRLSNVLRRLHYFCAEARAALTDYLWSRYLTENSICPQCGGRGKKKVFGRCNHIYCVGCMAFDLGYGTCSKCAS